MVTGRAARAALVVGAALAACCLVATALQATAAPRRTPAPRATAAGAGAGAAGATAAADGAALGTLTEAERVGLAAIAGAGLQVRHSLKVKGPDPSIAALGAASPPPTASPSASGQLPGGHQVAGIPAAWHSGASGDAAVSGAFGSWRGEPLQILGTWSDTTAESQRDVDSLGSFSGWDGDIDVAIGGLVSGETWAAAASGAYLGRWRQAVRSIRAQRAGHHGVVYIRFAHEMTGDWFPWQVNSGNVSAFKRAWRLFHGLLEQEYPQARLVFSPNDGSASDVALDQIWPGDDVVDVVGPDSYDGWPNKTSEALWDEWIDSTDRGPKGLGAWRRFAATHGKPLALPEWGVRTQDNAFYITKMHQFLAACAPRPGDTSLAGKCVYDIYFNIANGGNAGFMIYGGPNPNAAQTYRHFVWGTR